MFHKAIDLQFKEGTRLEVTFQSGEVKSYDVAVLFDKYPQLKTLKKRRLFKSGKLVGYYGIIWNEELDLEVESVYECGTTVDVKEMPICMKVANSIYEARIERGLSQTELAELTRIDQSDISKIERGVANPSLQTIERICKAMNVELNISIKIKDA